MDGPYDPEQVLRAAGAVEQVFRSKAPQRGKPFGKLRLLTLEDAEHAPPRQYLLDSLIARQELSLWWGAPKCGKSFLLLYLAFSLALGRDAFGRRARRSRVLYVAAEGEGGFAGRVLALKRDLGDPGEHFTYIAQRAQVGPPGGDLASIIGAAHATGAELIVLDTLARTFGAGDENSAKDMGGYIEAADLIREATGAHVAVIHHGRKDGGDTRGSGALAGAADLIVKVERGAKGEPNRAEVQAAKDEVDGTVLGFRLRTVELECNGEAEPRRTCVAEEAESNERPSGPKVPPAARRALQFLCDLILAEGAELPQGPGYPSTVLRGVQENRWREQCDSRRLSTSEDAKNRARVFRAAFQQLRDLGHVAAQDGWVWATRPGGDFDAD
jgi:hypothetical protein